MAESAARVVVVYASKHGSTKEIAEALQSALAARGVKTQLASVDEPVDLSDCDAIVFGSAVYMGRWMKSARDFAAERAGDFAGKPVWLFSSGPIGDPPGPVEEPFGIADLKTKLRARDHHVFAGKVDKSQLGFAERAVLAAVRAQEGDSRDWNDIRRWAEAIAGELVPV
jgi:menaquinone-dependent protoporphyrinogen oxidase